MKRYYGVRGRLTLAILEKLQAVGPLTSKDVSNILGVSHQMLPATQVRIHGTETVAPWNAWKTISI